MSLKPAAEGPLLAIEKRLRHALLAEADRWSRREPPRLAASCRARRQNRPPRSRYPWRWPAAAAAAALFLLLLPFLTSKQKNARQDVYSRPAVVSPSIDREALYAALPKIPEPTRPPRPLHVAADRVIVMPPR